MGLQLTYYNDGLQPKSDCLRPTSDGLQPGVRVHSKRVDFLAPHFLRRRSRSKALPPGQTVAPRFVSNDFATRKGVT